MEKDLDMDYLGQLCAEIEQAWQKNQDASVVDRLIAKHPEYAETLDGFLSILAFGDSAVPEEVLERVTENTERWLEEEGYELAKAAARQVHQKQRTTPTPTETAQQDSGQSKPFVRLLQDKIGERVDDIAQNISEVTPEFLILAGRHPHLMPVSVRQRLAGCIQESWGISQEEILATLNEQPAYARAASRRGPVRDPESFEDILALSTLSAEQRSHWEEVAKG